MWQLGLGEAFAVSALHGRGGDLLDAILAAIPRRHERRMSWSVVRVGSPSWANPMSGSQACSTRSPVQCGRR